MAMPPTPQSQRWPSDRAVLFVHGVGNAHQGDYSLLVAQVERSLGEAANRFAFYCLYYDQVNDWFAGKTQASAHVEGLVSAIRSLLAAPNGKTKPETSPEEPAMSSFTFGNAAADFAGDVLWPVLLADARTAVRETYLNQLRQIVRDGESAGYAPRDQHISIVTHSLGCFHTYEALHEAAADEGLGLSPATYGVHLDNVIFMASPVQLIRSVGRAIEGAIPQPRSLYTMSGDRLEMPFELDVSDRPVPMVRRTVSITGNLDPVGGHFLRSRAPWAYMNLPGQESFIDQQELVSGSGNEDLTLAGLLQDALREGGPPHISPQNPHDWSAYIARHADQLEQWLTA